VAYLRPLIALGAALSLAPGVALARPPVDPTTPTRDEPPPAESTPAAAAAPADAPPAEPTAPPAPPPVDLELTRDPVPMSSTTPFQPKPPPLHVEYLQYGVALAANARLASGATCPEDAEAPCILGGGGGLVVRVGWRPPGPWYVGSAYEFANMDSGNLYRLGILQQLRVEMRYMPETGLRTAPYASWGLGGFGYGNEWGVETGGAVACAGGGVEFEVTRFALVGVAASYSPMLIAGWTDTADQRRELSLAHFMRFELVFELRSELSREDPDAWQVAAGTPPSL
jgi:hypothetical protein